MNRCSIRAAASPLLLTCLGLCLAVAAGRSLPAQQKLSDEDVTFNTVRPKHLDVRELHTLLDHLHGRDLSFEDGRSIRNILLGSHAVLIYDEKNALEKILRTVETLDVAPVPSAQDLELLVYQPQNIEAHALFGIAQRVLGRQVPDSSGGTKQNLSAADNTIVVNDVGEAAREIVAKLKVIDDSFASMAEARDPSAYTTLEYRPRALGLRAIENALMSFRRAIEIGPAAERRSRPQVQNLMFSYEEGFLVMRDTPDNVAAARELLEKIDKPPSQVTLTCFVLSARADEQGDAPEDLSNSLRKLLPHRSYRIESTGLVRTSAQPGKRVGITMLGPVQPNAFGRQTTYQLNAVISAFDATAPSISLDRCTAMVDGAAGSRQMFDTSTTIFGDEYAVLGVVGGEPLFVVLRMTTAAGKNKAD